MHVFLETDRLILRRFTADDENLLFELDNDPDVMLYINGGAPVPRAEIVDETIPAFLSYYDRFDGYGFWAVIEKESAADSSAGSTSGRARGLVRWNRNSGTACTGSAGTRDTAPRVLGR